MDGEGASKFISIEVLNAAKETDAKKLLFQLPIHLWLKLLFQAKIPIGVE